MLSVNVSWFLSKSGGSIRTDCCGEMLKEVCVKCEHLPSGFRSVVNNMLQNYIESGAFPARGRLPKSFSTPSARSA